MAGNQLFARKSIETLLREMEGENRLRRVLGPIALTSLGVGAIIGAGIFVMTGRAAAVDAGPAILLSYAVAGVACTLAALCYAEFASSVPVAGSAYTYAYATLGELLAWIIGWDLVLEYALACAVVAAAWSHYFNEFLMVISGGWLSVPTSISSDPFTTPGAYFNLPAVFIMAAVTIVLVIGIRESATTNAALVILKVAVVLFVICVGVFFIDPVNWTSVPVTDRLLPEELELPLLAEDRLKAGVPPDQAEQRIEEIVRQVSSLYSQASSLPEPAAAAQRERIERQIRRLYDDAKLPEDKDQAAARVMRLATQGLVHYRIERKRNDIEASMEAEELSPAEAKAALETVLTDAVAYYADHLRRQEKFSKQEATATKDACQASLAEVVAPYLKQLEADGKLSSAEAETILTQAATRYTGPLERHELMSAAEGAALRASLVAKYRSENFQVVEENPLVEALLEDVRKKAPEKVAAKWGLLGTLGLNRWLVPIDDSLRSPFIPYGFSGIMLGAAIVFFAYIGFDSISTHSEEARNPKRDVPIGILASLAICTVLYIGVSAVITGMEPYPEIDRNAAVAAAFRHRAETMPGLGGTLLRGSGLLIATGALAGMTSVLLISFLSQARIFLAMARDGLLPPAIFGAVHPRFKTPHISTIVTGVVICLVAAFTPIAALEEMVSIGTLMAFAIVCAAVLVLRVTRPDVERPFRCPLVWVVAPLGVLVNLFMMLFLPVNTWLRLVGWLALGLVIYFGYGMWNSSLRARLADAGSGNVPAEGSASGDPPKATESLPATSEEKP
jgi:amino acid transporter